MAEVKGGILNEGRDIIRESHYNESVSVSNTVETTLISAKECFKYNNGSVTTYNGGTGGTLSVKVYVSDKELPTTFTATGGWVQLGSTISVASGSANASQWSGVYKWVGLTGTMGTATGTTDVNTYLMLCHQ